MSEETHSFAQPGLFRSWPRVLAVVWVLLVSVILPHPPLVLVKGLWVSIQNGINLEAVVNHFFFYQAEPALRWLNVGVFALLIAFPRSVAFWVLSVLSTVAYLFVCFATHYPWRTKIVSWLIS